MKGSELIIKLNEEGALARGGGANSISLSRGIFPRVVHSLPRRAPDVAIGTKIGFVALRCREMDFILCCNNAILYIAQSYFL